MLDTARNFIPVLKIKEVKAGLHEGKIQNLLPCQLLDSMSYSKLNVFHWHVTDSQVKLVDINTLRNISNARFDTNCIDRIVCIKATCKNISLIEIQLSA